MAINSGKHTEKVLEDVMCRIIESKISAERMNFLKELLEFNGQEVIVSEEKKKNEEDPTLYTIGVTDLIFNPVIAVYERKLRTKDGKKVNAKYWNQKKTDFSPDYWNKKKY